MPIPFLSDRYRAQRLGRVRLGIKVVSERTGKTHPVATPYFVLEDAVALKDIYGEQPTSMNIEFLWDNLEFTFPYYMRRYTSSGLRCLGDGEMVLYRVNDKGDVDVRDGNAIHPNGKVVMAENQPVKVACEGEYCLAYQDGSCKPTGFLRFLPIEAPRLGYYDVVCHQRAIVGILTQLKLTLASFHRLTGIPFVLHRGEEEKVPVKVPGKGMVDMPVRTQWVEVQPSWFAENWPQREKYKALAAAKVRQDIIELFGEDSNSDDSPSPPAATEELAKSLYEGEGVTDLGVPEVLGEIAAFIAEHNLAVPEKVNEAMAEPVIVEVGKPPRIEIDLAAIETLGDLFAACLKHFKMYKQEVLREAGVSRQEDLVDHPRVVFERIVAARGIEVVTP